MTRFPIEDVRNSFPALSRNNGAEAPLIFDNPAGTQLPQRVIDAVSEAMVSASSNLGGYFAGSKATEAIWLRAHEAMVDMLGANSMREIIIGQSMMALTLHLSRSIRPKNPDDGQNSAESWLLCGYFSNMAELKIALTH